MKFYLFTDLEGVAGVDKFAQCQGTPEAKTFAMKQLTREVNACIEGIRDVHPDAEIDVWDGHGSGGILKEEIVGGRCLVKDRSDKAYYHLQGYDAMLFVGQHAMAGTAFATLCHTYSSLHIQYYKLNGLFVGEFTGGALVAGLQGVPTIYLAGDDKAASEAKVFIPEIETTIVKRGTGLESAIHVDQGAACAMIRRDSARAVRRIGEIPPFTGIRPPYTLEIRRVEPLGDKLLPGAKRIDDRAFILEAESALDFKLL